MAKDVEVERWSSDTEGDEVPITQTLQTKTHVGKSVVESIPEGDEAVCVGVARDFGNYLGMFKGNVVCVKENRQRHVYHVVYEDGDEKDN
jgi:hypothetical protein